MTSSEKLHDLYVWKLSKDLSESYDSVSTHVVLHEDKRIAAEIDILAKRGNVTHVYEVKVSHRIVKAKHQFLNIRKYYDETIQKFFLYCASSDSLHELSF